MQPTPRCEVRWDDLMTRADKVVLGMSVDDAMNLRLLCRVILSITEFFSLRQTCIEHFLQNWCLPALTALKFSAHPRFFCSLESLIFRLACYHDIHNQKHRRGTAFVHRDWQVSPNFDFIWPSSAFRLLAWLRD